MIYSIILELQVQPKSCKYTNVYSSNLPTSLQVGLLDEEKILPLGAEVTAVGVLSTTSDGSVVIKSCKRLPMFLYVSLPPQTIFWHLVNDWNF